MHFFHIFWTWTGANRGPMFVMDMHCSLRNVFSPFQQWRSHYKEESWGTDVNNSWHGSSIQQDQPARSKRILVPQTLNNHCCCQINMSALLPLLTPEWFINLACSLMEKKNYIIVDLFPHISVMSCGDLGILSFFFLSFSRLVSLCFRLLNTCIWTFQWGLLTFALTWLVFDKWNIRDRLDLLQWMRAMTCPTRKYECGVILFYRGYLCNIWTLDTFFKILKKKSKL